MLSKGVQLGNLILLTGILSKTIPSLNLIAITNSMYNTAIVQAHIQIGHEIV